MIVYFDLNIQKKIKSREFMLTFCVMDKGLGSLREDSTKF